MYDDEDDALEPLGWVPLDGRGSLPFALVHGESLVAAASWAVGEAGIQLVDASVSHETVRRSGRPLLIHEPLCPLAPASLLVDALALAETTGQVVVGYRPVTDTVKVREGGRLGETVDRAGLRSVATPVVIPAAVLADLDALDMTDLAVLVDRLASRSPITWIEVPPLARRIVDEADLRILEALSSSLA